MIERKILMAGLLLPLLFSCSEVSDFSVKEDRTDCPFFYDLDIYHSRQTSDRVDVDIWKEGVHLYDDDNLVMSDYMKAKRTYVIPKGEVIASSYAGVDRSRVENGQYRINPGFESEKLFAWVHDFENYEEEYQDSVVLHKQYAKVNLVISDAILSSSTDYFNKLYLSGETDGIDLRTLEPTRGEFFTYPKEGPAHEYTFYLPRQINYGRDLVLSFFENEKEVSRINLGELILSAGYDWLAEDLDDIVVGMDYFKASVTINIAPWEQTWGWSEII